MGRRPRLGKTSMTLINKDNVMNLLQRAVDEKGADYIDPHYGEDRGCIYFEDAKTPCCIVGHVLSYVDETAGERILDAEANAETITHLPKYFLDMIEDEALHVLRRAQSMQDAGKPWGVALEVARPGR